MQAVVFISAIVIIAPENAASLKVLLKADLHLFEMRTNTEGTTTQVLST